MDLDWSVDGKVSISMIKYVYKILEDFIEVISRTAATPARANLFQVRAEELAEELPEELAIAFHHAVAQLLFLSLRARRDIQLPTAFLTKRVKKPDRDDWGKLLRVLEYLNGTKHMKLTLEVDDLSMINWFIDASHQVHDDCKGHTGGAMTMGKGAITSISRGQKTNTKSSTETEMVGTDDILPQTLWTKYFIEAQGYTVEHNILHQDNQSCMRLLINGPHVEIKTDKAHQG